MSEHTAPFAKSDEPEPPGLDELVESLIGTSYAETTAALTALHAVVENESTAKKLLRLMDALEENDDVQAVYANFDIPEGILDAVAA